MHLFINCCALAQCRKQLYVPTSCSSSESLFMPSKTTKCSQCSEMYSILTSSFCCFKTFRLVWCSSFQNKIFQKRENIKFHYNILWCAVIHILKNYICLFYSCVYICMCMYMCHRECKEVTGQRTRGVSSLLPTCAFQEWNSNHQTWQKSSLPTQLSHWPR